MQPAELLAFCGQVLQDDILRVGLANKKGENAPAYRRPSCSAAPSESAAAPPEAGELGGAAPPPDVDYDSDEQPNTNTGPREGIQTQRVHVAYQAHHDIEIYEGVAGDRVTHK